MNPLRFDNFIFLVDTYGGQSALARELKKALGQFMPSQQNISDIVLQKSALSRYQANRIEKAIGLPKHFLDAFSLREVSKADISVGDLRSLDGKPRCIIERLSEQSSRKAG